jgi:hypothetical protein
LNSHPQRSARSHLELPLSKNAIDRLAYGSFSIMRGDYD